MNIFTFWRERVVPLLRSKDSPERLALGAAIGTFVGLTPTVGVQMAMVVLVAATPKLKFNVPLACAMVWISNPLTMIPLYYGMYWLGVLLLGRREMHFDKFEATVQALIDSIKNGESLLESAWQGLTGMFSIGMHVAVPMWIGGTVLGIISALPTYIIVLRVVRRRRAAISDKIARHNKRPNTSTKIKK